MSFLGKFLGFFFSIFEEAFLLFDLLGGFSTCFDLRTCLFLGEAGTFGVLFLEWFLEYEGFFGFLKILFGLGVVGISSKNLVI